MSSCWTRCAEVEQDVQSSTFSGVYFVVLVGSDFFDSGAGAGVLADGAGFGSAFAEGVVLSDVFTVDLVSAGLEEDLSPDGKSNTGLFAVCFTSV